MNEPESYWEKRCAINENVLNELIIAVGIAMPHTQHQLSSLGEAWEGAINKLDAEESVDFMKTTEKT